MVFMKNGSNTDSELDTQQKLPQGKADDKQCGSQATQDIVGNNEEDMRRALIDMFYLYKWIVRKSESQHMYIYHMACVYVCKLFSLHAINHSILSLPAFPRDLIWQKAS